VMCPILPKTETSKQFQTEIEVFHFALCYSNEKPKETHEGLSPKRTQTANRGSNDLGNVFPLSMPALCQSSHLKTSLDPPYLTFVCLFRFPFVFLPALLA
jgi:hypothetical protein